MERVLPPGISGRPKHGFSTPYDDWLRASLGHEVERRYAAGSPMSELVAPQGVRPWSTSTGAAAPTTRASSTACSSCPSGTRRSSSRRDADPLRALPQGELRGPRPRDPRRALRGRRPLPAGPGTQPGEGPARRAALRPRVRLVCLLAHLLPHHAGLAAAKALGDGHRRLRHGQHARHRLRPPAGRASDAREPLDLPPGEPPDHQLELLAGRDRAQHPDPALARGGGAPRSSRPLRRGARREGA